MIKFYYNNLIDDCEVVGTNQNEQFKASNIKDFRRTKVFRSTTNEDSVSFDFGENSAINTVFMVDNPQINGGFGFNQATLSASSSPSFTPDLLNLNAPLDDKFGESLNEFDEISARYFRVAMDSTLGYCELSNLFVGKSLELTEGKSINFGWTHQDSELINKSFNREGQQFNDLIGNQKIINISFSNLSKDQIEQLDEMFDYCGTYKPLWLKIGCPNMSNTLQRMRGMFFIQSKPVKTNTFFNRYSLSINLREAR